MPAAPPPVTVGLALYDGPALRARIAGHLDGSAPFAGGLDCYYALEEHSSLLGFHTMLRSGERNRTHDGLQQSYGDHNRLLMHALDRLLAGDRDWLRVHLAPGAPVDDATLASVAAAASALAPTPEVEIALWLGAGLHDCGMLGGQSAHVDVEDGRVWAAPVLADLCPPSTRPVAEFALRHHDYVKDLHLGEVPVALVADDLDALDPDARAPARAAIGLIQVAGAASLGTGRLTAFRCAVFASCLRGEVFTDRSPARRLGRLLAPSPDDPTLAPPVDLLTGPLLDLGPGLGPDDLASVADDPAWRELLLGTGVHGWHGVVADVPPDERLTLLAEVAEIAATTGADHVVLDRSLRDGGQVRLGDAGAEVHRAASGRTVVTLAPGTAGSRGPGPG